MARRVAGFVIDHRLAGRCTPAGGQAHLFFGHRVVISAPALGQHHDLGEQAVADVTGRALAAEGGAIAGRHEGAFALGIQGVAAALPRQQQGIVVTPGVGGDVTDRAKRLHTIDLETHMPVGNLGVDVQLTVDGVLVVDTFAIGVGLERQQVLQIDRQAIAGSDAQHQRARSLVRAQGDLPGRGVTPLGDQYALGIHHITAQSEHHAIGVLRAEAVEHQWLIHRHDVGHQGALALHGRLRRLTPGEPHARKQDQPGRF
ncbi:hypothetical protein D3C76_1058720 [compost metagenome]